MRGNPLSEDSRRKLLALHAEGHSTWTVAQRLGCSQTCVLRWLRRLGIPPNGARTPASRRKRSESITLFWRLRKLRSLRSESWREITWAAGEHDLGSNGYALFGALCRAGWPIHDRTDVQVLGSRGRLLVRCPEESAAVLAGSSRVFSYQGQTIELGEPSWQPLQPRESLACRLAVIKGKMDDQSFRDSLLRSLDHLGVEAEVQVGERRVIRVVGRTIVGYQCSLHGLIPRHSVLLQAAGIGGRHRFGCGVLLPC